jgi:hypothetical protein
MSDIVRCMADPGGLVPRHEQVPDGGRVADRPAAAGGVHVLLRLTPEYEPLARRHVVHMAPAGCVRLLATTRGGSTGLMPIATTVSLREMSSSSVLGLAWELVLRCGESSLDPPA